MTMTGKNLFEIVGIGLGPANLALATAIEEQKLQQKQLNNCLFLDKKAHFNWHLGMMLPGSKLQVPFLRDLATLRNPQSPFTFLNYLKVKQRLDHFINLRSFYPSRAEFCDYLNWVCQQLTYLTKFNCEVKKISPLWSKDGNIINALKVTYFNKTLQQWGEVVTSNIVVGMGKQPYIPIGAAVADARIFHTDDFLNRFPLQFYDVSKEYHFIVVGSGQSAGEVVLYLLNHFPNARIHLCFRSAALKGIDNSPFVNQQYHEAAIDEFFQQNDTARAQILADLKQSNYSVMDLDLLASLTQLDYENRLSNEEHLLLHNNMQLQKIIIGKDSIEVAFDNLLNSDNISIKADGIILATGYHQTHAFDLLAEVEEFLVKDQQNNYSVTRDYRLVTQSCFTAGIYLQGYCENSHGPSDATLAVLATRVERIVNSVLQYQQVTTKRMVYAIGED